MDLVHWSQQFIVRVHDVPTPDYADIGRTFWVGLLAAGIVVGILALRPK